MIILESFIILKPLLRLDDIRSDISRTVVVKRIH